MLAWNVQSPAGIARRLAPICLSSSREEPVEVNLRRVRVRRLVHERDAGEARGEVAPLAHGVRRKTLNDYATVFELSSEQVAVCDRDGVLASGHPVEHLAVVGRKDYAGGEELLQVGF